MNEKIKALVLARNTAAQAKEDLAVYKAQNDQLQTLEAAHKEAKTILADAENQMRTEALAIYEETGNKAPHENVDIKMFTTFEVDYDIATPWVKINMPAMLVVDKKAFKKYLPVAPNLPDGVTEVPTPRATIASKIVIE